MSVLFELNKVNFRYADGSLALSEVDAQVQLGERLAIVGSNGSGKSTLLRSLNGLIEPTSGSILYEGEELTDKALRKPDFQFKFRSRVGFVFQDADAQLFNATVAEEVAFAPIQLGLDPTTLTTRVNEILAFLGISHLAERAPFRLSGGEKRKVAIASVLAMNPDTILLDEPFVGLDPRSQTWLVSTLNQLQRAGKTTIVATHSLDTLSQIADRALVLSEEHKLLGSFNVKELLDDLPTLRRASLIFEQSPTIRPSVRTS